LAFLRYVIGVIGDIRRICRLENIAILHCHLSDAEFLGILAGRLHGVERILDTVHTPSLLPSRESHDPRTSLRKLFMPWVLNQADWVVAVSAETGRMLEKMGVQAKRIRVVENGIDVSAYDLPPQPALRQSLGIGPDEPVLVTTARLTEQKGHAYLIEAMPAVLERFPLARLLLLGQGELRGQLEERVRSLGLTGRVDFLGVRSDVPALLALADVFVLPSLWEGTSLALLEAMAAARPIAATDIPGNRPLLEDQRDCLLTTPARPEALAQAVIRLLQDRELAAKLGTQARAEAWQRFDIRTMLAAYERLWATSPRDQETS
jgi:glycosyltransferase involved in cell wall biosynthesis